MRTHELLMEAPGSCPAWLLPACLSHPPHASLPKHSSSSDFGHGLLFISCNISLMLLKCDCKEWCGTSVGVMRNGCWGASQARCSWRSKEPQGVGEWSYGGGSQDRLTPLWLPLWRTELGSSALGSIPLNTGGLIGNRCQAVGVKYRHLSKCQPFPWATAESSVLILTGELGTNLLHMLMAWLDPEGLLALCKISSQMTAPKIRAHWGVHLFQTSGSLK